MNDAMCMGVVHRHQHLADHCANLIVGHLPAPSREVLREVVALDELHDDREHVVLLDEVMDRNRARMAPRAEHSCLADEATTYLRVTHEVQMEAFERDVAT